MSITRDFPVPAADLFLRRMLWRVGLQPMSVVALLGPRGSGRSAMLRSMSHSCGGTVVHVKIDFGLPEEDSGRAPLDAATAVAVIASGMSRSWVNLRSDLTFHRVGLCLLAMNENLEQSRAAARVQIERLIKQYVRTTPPGRRAAKIEESTDRVMAVASLVAGLDAGKVVDSIREPVGQFVGGLLRRLAKRDLTEALAWHTHHVDAEGAQFIDRLIAIGRTDRHQRLTYLVQALFADITDNVARRQPMRSKCRCVLPTPQRHDHAWVLLVDNADTVGGQQFLASVMRVKAELFRAPADSAVPDPLLVVTAVDRWKPEWNSVWAEPWLSDLPPDGRRRRVPVLDEATRESWAPRDGRDFRVDRDGFGFWFPVWLGGLPVEDTVTAVGARVNGADDPGLGVFAHRLSGGHPAAIEQVRVVALTAPAGFPTVRGQMLVHRGDSSSPPWDRGIRDALRDVVTIDEPPWSELPGALVAASYFADPWRGADDRLPDGFSTLPRAVALLKESLWISTFATRPSPLWSIARGEQCPPATVHPWLTWCLLAGAHTLSVRAEETGAPVSAWDEVFGRLRRAVAQETSDRRLFYDLALGNFAPVVAALAERFDTVEDREWVRLLDDVTSAPCRLLVTQSPADAHHSLVGSLPHRRSALYAATAGLVAALWLRRSPFIGATRQWDTQVQDGFQHLKLTTTRNGRAALSEAERRFDPEVSTGWA